MAAKPPKPPGNLLNNNSPPAKATEDNKNKQLNQSNENNSNNNNYNNNNYNNNNYTASYSSNEPDSVHISNHIDPTTITTSPSTKPSCNCSNISIMHLFHEMKQEFPTIPDQIVTQCVNENCHDRDNCLLMLRNELALNPIPVQAYPSKVLQRQQQQQKLQQQQQQQQQQKPSTLLKPTRVAPLPVSVSACVASLNSNNNVQTVVNSTKKHFNNNNPTLPLTNFKNCDSVSVSVDGNLQSSKVDKKDVENLSKNLSKSVCVAENTKTTANASDMPTTKTISTTDNSCQQEDATQQQQQQQQQQTQRARPTTLNLNLPHQQQQQQQLRQQLNVQLQQHLQQLQQPQLPKKPVRKAPLPPLPPKPSNNNNYTPAALPTRAVQHSSNTSLSSPASSGESEISVNVGSLSSPTTTAFVGTSTSAAQQQTQQHHHLKSPIRHRSVINVQPEPPYTRDFLVSPTSSSAGSNSQKSFTSVNLTLRQPNTSAPQSTIDISAGPGLSSAGGTGLTYSSTSYDARRGCQKNFHITVTDEGGVFSASRIKPRSCYNPAGEQEHDLPGSGIGVVDVDVNLMRSPTSEQHNQQYPYSYQQQQQQQRIVASVNNYADMCLPRENDGFKEILHRQRARREKLTTALRDNKKRLSQVEQEINFLTEPISPGESERLDSEIRKLRCDCEAMLNEVENSKRSAPSIANSQGFNSINSRQQQQLLYQAHPPQPFPRQRSPRPPPTTAGRQPMDFIQHHAVSSTPPTMNSPNQQLPPLPPTYQQLQQQYQQQLLQQQQILQQQQQQQHHQHHYHQQHPQQPSTDDEDYSDSNTDGGDEEDEEGLDMWACSLCTFRNHPQLNICECCENVRILPGRIRIVPTATTTVANSSQSPATPLLLTQLSASSATHATATPTLTRAEIAAANSPTTTAAGVGSNSLESETSLTQQQFALHT